MTNDEIITACRLYESRREMRDNAPALLQGAYKRGLKDVAFVHMEKERHYVSDGASEKACTSCGAVKPLSLFYRVSGSDRVRGACKACCDRDSAAWRVNNAERAREIVRASSKRYPEKVRERAAIKRRRNPHVFAARDMLKRVLSITGKKKSGKTEECMGYTASDLRAHIEAQFSDGMSWDNHGDWHIDHIDPVASMVARGVADPKEINALSNLRPLWAYDNLSRPKPRT